MGRHFRVWTAAAKVHGNPANGGDAFRRWWRAFEGLHTLLGFAQQIGDRPEVGYRFARHLQCTTVIRAWFRTARELQLDPSMRVGAIYAFDKADDDPLEDSVAPGGRFADNSAVPTTFTSIWTPA